MANKQKLAASCGAATPGRPLATPGPPTTPAPATPAAAAPSPLLERASSFERRGVSLRRASSFDRKTGGVPISPRC